MITPRSRIRRIIKHLNGHRFIDKHDFELFLPGKTLHEDEEPIAMYQDPDCPERIFLLFTNKRLFLNENDRRDSLLLADIENVIRPPNKEELSRLTLCLKGDRLVKLPLLGGHPRNNPAWGFLRLFSRLITDFNGE